MPTVGCAAHLGDQVAQAHGGSTVGSKVADSDNRRLRSIELWLNAALLAIAAIGIIAIGAFAMQFVLSDTPNPPAAARAASPVSVPAPERPAEAVAPAPPAAPAPVTTAAPPDAAPPATIAPPPAALPSAAAIAEPASPPPAAGRLPTGAPPAARPAPAPARAAPAPRADDIARLADYVADLNRQGGANPAPWIGEQIDTAVSRQRELGC